MKDRKAWLSLPVSMAAGFALIVFAVRTAAYGWWLFLGVPFLVGFIAVLTFTWGERRKLAECLSVTIWPFVGTCVLVLIFRIDGFICCAMAALPAILLGMLGGWIAWLAQRRRTAGVLGSCLVLLIPPGVLFGPRGPRPRTFMVTTSIAVNAPPEIVWRYVTDFPAIALPPDAIFRAGVAYPIKTEIDGEGIGSARRCVLSTGTLSETVTAWKPPYLLRFRVDSTPPAMRELSPWPDLDPPHLHGFYVSKQGEFRLTELPGGRTLIEGTSWYSHGLEPAQYWRLWSDYIVHGVHRRVLENIKRLAEEDRRAGRNTVATSTF
jgi:hypothetical protein